MSILFVLKEWWCICFDMSILLILKEWWYLFSHEYSVDIERVVVSIFT